MSFYWLGRRKKISAMIRVKNEDEFLFSSVCSIAGLVEEIVIIDNLSTDGTPEIVARLRRDLGSKVKVYAYQHAVPPYGEESHALQRKDPGSPGLLHNYYNWCLSKCSMPFVMKWDGDMIAMDGFVPAIEKFKKSGELQFSFGGHNVACDRKHALAWVAVIEPRIYPKMLTRFTYGAADGCEVLNSWVVHEKTLVIKEPLYLHMKFCKSDAPAHAINSPGFKQKAETKADLLPPDAAASIKRWLS